MSDLIHQEGEKKLSVNPWLNPRIRPRLEGPGFQLAFLTMAKIRRFWGTVCPR